MWQQDVTTATTSWYGWVASGVASGSATAGVSTSDYTYYFTTAYPDSVSSPPMKRRPKKKPMPEPEPCTDEELEEFLFGGA